MLRSAFLFDGGAFCPASLLERARGARAAPLRLGIVRASAPLPMETAKRAFDAGIAEPVLIGEAGLIGDEAEALGWDISGVEIHDIDSERGDGEQGAIDRATALVREGSVDALMKGHIHTDIFMGGIVKRDAGIRGEVRMTHIFALFHPGGGSPVLISDGAVNVLPDMKTRQQMLRSARDVAHSLGIEMPRIAIVSATETAIASIPSSMEAKALSDWAQQNIEGAIVDGPLSFDLAVSPEAVAIKGIGDERQVAGGADILIVPDITSGNILFKAMVWYSGACAAGVVMGGRVPIILTSRADSPEARLASIALAALC